MFLFVTQAFWVFIVRICMSFVCNMGLFEITGWEPYMWLLNINTLVGNAARQWHFWWQRFRKFEKPIFSSSASESLWQCFRKFEKPIFRSSASESLWQCFRKFEKLIVSVRLWSMCPSEWINQTTLMQATFGCFSHSIKIRGLLEYADLDLWEYVFVVKI